MQLERSSGVGEVRIVGGLERAINVWVDADRLAAYQIPITAVRDAIVAPERRRARRQRHRAPATRRRCAPWAASPTPAAFNDLVVATVNGAPIRVRDIGRAEDGTKEQRSVARLNGVPTVTLEVRRQSGANTVAVIEAVKANLARIAGAAPARRASSR